MELPKHFYTSQPTNCMYWLHPVTGDLMGCPVNVFEPCEMALGQFGYQVDWFAVKPDQAVFEAKVGLALAEVERRTELRIGFYQITQYMQPRVSSTSQRWLQIPDVDKHRLVAVEVEARLAMH